MRLISLAALTVLDLAPAAMVSCAAEAGYDGVGLRLIPATPQEPHYDTIGDTPTVRDIRRRLDDTGLRVIDVEILRLTPDTNAARDFSAFMETAAYLGAAEVLVAGNDGERDRLVHNLGELAGLAQACGLTPNLEFMPWTDVKNLTEAAEVLGAVGHRNVGLLVDALHLDRSRSRTEDIAGLPQHWFRYAQLCDAPVRRPADTDELLYEARHGRLLPGDGGLALAAFIAALPADLTISVEAPVVSARSIPALARAQAALAATRTILEQA